MEQVDASIHSLPRHARHRRPAGGRRGGAAHGAADDAARRPAPPDAPARGDGSGWSMATPDRQISLDRSGRARDGVGRNRHGTGRLQPPGGGRHRQPHRGRARGHQPQPRPGVAGEHGTGRRAGRPAPIRSPCSPTAATSQGPEVLACAVVGIIPICSKPLTSGAKADGRFSKQDFVYRPDRLIPIAAPPARR